MSWAEENLQLGYDGEDFNDIEEMWKDGYHRTEALKEIELSEMTIGHLRNTIKRFKNYDTAPLEKELKKRI